MIKTVLYLKKPFDGKLEEERPLYRLIAPNGDVYETRGELGNMRAWLEDSCAVEIQKGMEKRVKRGSCNKIGSVHVVFPKGRRRIVFYPKDKEEASLWYNTILKPAIELEGNQITRKVCTPLLPGEPTPCLEGTIQGYS